MQRSSREYSAVTYANDMSCDRQAADATTTLCRPQVADTALVCPRLELFTDRLRERRYLQAYISLTFEKCC